LTLEPIDREADPILGTDIRIEAAIVLGKRIGGRAGGYEVRDIGHSVEAAANAWITGTSPAQILRTQA